MKSIGPIYFLVIACLVQMSCASGSGKQSNQPSCCAKAEAPTAFTDKSIYQVESIWTTDEAKQLKLGELRGRPQVVAMFFTSCQFACPIIVNDLKRIEASLPPELAARVGFTLVSAWTSSRWTH